MAIIDWEFVASAPYASLHRVIEMLFRKSASNGFGAEYPLAVAVAGGETWKKS
jgi:hypothetical protein